MDSASSRYSPRVDSGEHDKIHVPYKQGIFDLLHKYRLLKEYSYQIVWYMLTMIMSMEWEYVSEPRPPPGLFSSPR
jgi:hypothetical protein